MAAILVVSLFSTAALPSYRTGSEGTWKQNKNRDLHQHVGNFKPGVTFPTTHCSLNLDFVTVTSQVRYLVRSQIDSYGRRATLFPGDWTLHLAPFPSSNTGKRDQVHYTIRSTCRPDWGWKFIWSEVSEEKVYQMTILTRTNLGLSIRL